MAKTIKDYKADYAKAYKTGDLAGMRAANNGANAIRKKNGLMPLVSSKQGDLQHAKTVNLQNTLKSNIANKTSISNPAVKKEAIKSLSGSERYQYQTQKAINKLPESAPLRVATGVATGLLPVVPKKSPQMQQALQNSKAYKAGNIGGTIASFATGYGLLGKTAIKGAEKIAPKLLVKSENIVTKGVTKVAPKLNPEKAAKIGQNIVQSGIKDIAIGAPLNLNQAANKDGLRGKELAKSMALNTALDIGVGSALELAPILLKSGKKVASQTEFDKLPAQEKAEATKVIENRQANVNQVKPIAPSQTSNQAVQPVNTNLGTIASQEQSNVLKQSRKEPQMIMPKSIGADVQLVPKQKVSKVKTNTYQNTPMFTDAEKALMENKDYGYDVVSEKKSLAEAKQRLDTDFEGEVNDLPNKANFDGVDLDTSMGIMEKYLQEARVTGNYDQVNEWAKTVQTKGTQGGQMIQAFAKYSRTPEGKIIEGQRKVAEVQRKISEENPRLEDKVNQETKAAKTIIDKAQADTTEQLGDTLDKQLKQMKSKGQGKTKNVPSPAELLAEKIDATTKPPKSKEANLINDMVNELFRSAKEAPLPEKVAAAKRNPIEYLANAIQNKSQYTDVWNQAKAVLKDKYADNPEVTSMLNDYFEKGIVPTYSKTTIKNSINKTAKELGIDLNKIIKSAKGDKEKALADITQYITKETGATGEDAAMLADNLMTEYNNILKTKTESALKQMFRDVPKRGQKTTYEKVMELINMDAYSNEALKDIMRAKNNIPVLENEDIKGIFENMKLAESVDDPYMKRMYESKAQQIIANKIPAETTQKFAALQRLNMILNPKTLITRNPLGNALFAPVEWAKDIPASAVDRIVSLKTGQRTTTMNPHLLEQAKGAYQGLNEWGKDIKYGVDTSPSRGQVELPNGRTFNNGALHALDNALGKALQLGDRPFYQAAYNARTVELKKLGYKPEDIDELAKAYALDKVFQNDSTLSKSMGTIRRTVDDATGGIMGHLILPFSQTPSNLLDKLLDYSPAGYARAIAELGKVKNGIKQAGDKTDKTFDQKLFADRLGRALTGTGITLIGFALASKGLITGNEYDPTNKDLNAAKTKAGIPSYSIKVGDKYHSYEWIPVVGPLLAATADAYKAGAEGKDLIQMLGIGTKSSFNTVINQSMLQSIYSLFSGYDPASGMASTLLGSTSQFTQAGVAQIAKTIDPYVRETYDPNSLKQQGNKLISRIPFASKTLPKKLDASGQPIMQSQGRGTGARALENFLLPEKVTQVKKDPVNDELLRLNKSIGSNDMLLNVAPKKFTKSGQTYTLSAKDYTNYQQTMGQYADSKMAQLMKTDAYKKLSDTDKTKRLKKINEDATLKAREEYFSNNGLSPLLAIDEKKANKYSEDLKNVGISEQKYIDLLDVVKAANRDGKGATTRGEARRAMTDIGLTTEQRAKMMRALYRREKKTD